MSFYSTICNKTVEKGVVIVNTQCRLLKKVMMTIVQGKGAEFQHAMHEYSAGERYSVSILCTPFWYLYSKDLFIDHVAFAL